MNLWLRAGRYYSVGFAGAVVQVGILAFCIHVLGAGYRIAAIVALGLTLLHNFAWHSGWTWGDRRLTGKGLAVAFAGFVGSNGVVSLISTLALMPLLVELARLDPIVSNVASIVAGGLVNFWLACAAFKSGALLSQVAESRTHSIVPQCDV